MTISYTWRIQAFENCYLDEFSCYCGTDLRLFGFPYAPGDVIPSHARYSALVAHDAACKAIQNFGRQN